MSVFLQDHLTYIDDFRIDDTPDTADPSTEGVRAINFIINDVSLRHRWEFTLRRKTFAYYKDVREYALDPSFLDLKGVYEQMNFRDPFDMLSPIEFERRMNQAADQDFLSMDSIDGVKTLKINFVNTKSRYNTFLPMSSVTANGTWVNSGVATNLQSDNYVYFDNNGCVRFDVSGAGVATIRNNSFSNIDVSAFKKDYAQVGKIWVPVGSNLTSVSLVFGSQDQTKYHSITAITQANGRAFKDGLNTLAFDIKNAVDTGAPSESVIGAAQFNLTFAAAAQSVRISQFRTNSPDPLEIVYYADRWAFQASSGLWYNTFQDGNAPNSDYGAWSGTTYEWFRNVINLGAAWQMLLEMQEDARAEEYRIRYEGKDGTGGALAQAVALLPSRIKKIQPPSLALSTRSRTDYFDQG